MDSDVQASGQPDSAPLVLLTVEEAARRLSIGRTSMFKLLRVNEVDSVLIGQLRRIPAAEIDAYVRRLIAEQRVA